MATITENLNTIKTIKSDIKNAIITKGVEVSDSDSFTTYASKITDISTEATYKVPNGVKFALSTFTTVPETLDFSEVTNAINIFSSCRNLTYFDCSRFQSPLVNVGSTFNGCVNAVLSNVNSLNLSQCTEITYTFKSVKSITDSNLNNLDFSNMQILEGVFSGVDLGTLDVSG